MKTSSICNKLLYLFDKVFIILIVVVNSNRNIILINPRRVDNGKEAQSEESRQESCQEEKGSSQEKEGCSQEEKIKRFI